MPVESVANDIGGQWRCRRDGNRGCAQAKMEVDMRKLIAGMQISLDGKVERRRNAS